MNRADAFSKDLCGALKGKNDLEWVCGKPQKGQRECVDVIGKKHGKDRVLIEVELRRGAPFQNVVKVWRQISAGVLGENVVLVQAFSRLYGEKSNRRTMAEFIGREMQKAYPRVKYVVLPIDYLPKKRKSGESVIRGGGRRKQHAITLARKISRLLKRFHL